MLKYFKLFFGIILLFGYTDVFAADRYLTWFDPKTQLRARINLETYELLTEIESKGWLNEGKIKLDTSILNNIPSRIKNNYFLFDNGNRVRFTIDGTGRVYDYFPLKKEFVRVDNTYYSGYNFNSNKFVRNGILYSIGGIGFWNYSPNITYFDEKMKEWEIFRPINKIPIPMVHGYQGYDSKQDVYYSGGSEISEYLEDQKIKISDELFVFDFKKNKWDFLGKLNPELPLKQPEKIIWTGHFFLHFYNSDIFVINPQTNEVHQYKSTNKSLIYGYLNHVNKDTITIFWDENGGPVQKISISEIRSKSTYWGEFYSSGISSLWYYGGLSLFLGIGSLFGWRQNRFNKNKALSFSELERKLLLKLLELRKDEFLTTHDINDILETNDKTQDNQRKIRFKVIGELNNKLRLKFGCENGIDRKTLPEDKRLTVYVLDQQIVSGLRILLE
jgi:hypothetical protein